MALAEGLRGLATAELAARVRRTVDDMLDALPPGPVNLVTEFIEPLARWYVPEAVGLPHFEPAVIRPISDALTEAMDAGLVPAAREPGLAAQRRLARLIDSRVAEMPPHRPLRALLDAAAGAGMPRPVSTQAVRSLVVHGLTTVPAALGNALHALARDDLLGSGPVPPAATTGRAPHEFFRYEAPIQAATRLCVADTEVAGATFHRGDRVLMLLAAANRDPEAFCEPDQIRLKRWPNPHLSFGQGGRSRSGLMLAHLLLRQVLTVLARRRSTLRLVGQVRYKQLATVRTLAVLPVVRIDGAPTPATEPIPTSPAADPRWHTSIRLAG
jgi:cytochrome P450